MRARLRFVVAFVASCPLATVTLAQNAAPADVAGAIDLLTEKTKALKAGDAATAAAIQKIDAALDTLRDKKEPDYAARLSSELLKWTKALSKQDERSAGYKQVEELWLAIGGLRAPFEATDADIDALNKSLDGPLTDREKVQLLKKLPELGTRLDKFVAERGRRVHILSARYGDVSSSDPTRSCDATGYFVGTCEGKASCPAAADQLNGDTVCGYEPAPTAPDGLNFARVYYKCIYFALREYPDIRAQQNRSPALAIDLHRKDKLVCNVTN